MVIQNVSRLCGSRERGWEPVGKRSSFLVTGFQRNCTNPIMSRRVLYLSRSGDSMITLNHLGNESSSIYKISVEVGLQFYSRNLYHLYKNEVVRYFFNGLYACSNWMHCYPATIEGNMFLAFMVIIFGIIINN